MDTTDPQIIFDSDGICNHCTQYLKKRSEIISIGKAGAENFENIIKQIKKAGVGKKYDALLGISGGVDSCYTAYLLKKHGIRVLLVHMDNGWNSDDASLNILNVAKMLNLDYISYVLDWDEFKKIQLAFLKASVVEAETPTDVAIQGALHNVAAKHRIKYIISGGNIATEGILPKMWHYNAKDTKYFTHILRTYGNISAKKFPNFGYLKEIYYKIFRGVKTIYLLNYINYNKAEAIKILESELGWKYYGGKHYESRFTKFVQSYLLPLKFNLDYRKATLSSQICAGSITREEALAELNRALYNENDILNDKKYVSKKLGISIQELDEILQIPGKYYNQFPNDERWLNFIYGVYRRYFT
jgi:N-acetyl sugar amidotransferase